MCGIFGYIGPKNPVDVCIEGIKHLEYRGYDSAGIAGIIPQGALLTLKAAGKVQKLEEMIQRTIDRSKVFSAAIAHTRWATHGKPTEENAHPHFDGESRLAIVHNGIIENHAELRTMLQEKGYRFRSETDSEVIAQLIHHFYEGSLLTAVQKALSLLRGFWAIAVLHEDHPGEIIAATRESPLVIALNSTRSEAYLSSDPNAFSEEGLELIFLGYDEVAQIHAGSLKVYNKSAHQIEKALERLTLENQRSSKGDYAHYMLKEIHEQPQTLQQAFLGRILPDEATADFTELTLTPEELAKVSRILILACGTSLHAGMIAASLFEEMAHIRATAEIASEFRYRSPLITDDTLVISISQSGETLDTLAAIRTAKAKGARVLGICNVRGSTLSREATSCIYLRAGAEISVCSTKAFTSQLTVLFLFILKMARHRHLEHARAKHLLAELQSLPLIVQKVIEKQEQIQFLAKKYSHYKDFFFLGRHYMFPSSLEAALKLKEISYINATGYPAGEMKHGPIALISPELPVIGLLGNERTYEKMLSNLTEMKSRGAPILAFTFENSPHIDQLADDCVALPRIADELAPIPFAVACQLFAYFVALERGCEIDQPRNLAKSVTVE